MRALILTLLISLSLSAPASAQTVAQKKKNALRLFNKGETHYRLGEFKKALSYYRKALTTFRAPAFIFNIAQCHRQLKSYSQALFFYRLFLSEAPNASNKAEVKAFIRSMNKKLKAAQRRRQSVGKLSILTEPAGAAIYINRVKGTPNATSPALVQIPAGEHLIMVKKAGYKTIHKTVTVRSKRVVMVKLVLKRDVTARVTTPPERRRVITPPERRRVTTPPPERRRVLTPPPERRRAVTRGVDPIEPPTKPFYKRWWFWTGVGVAVLAIGAAGITGSEALSLKSEWDDLRGNVDNPDDHKSKTAMFGALTDVFIGVGVAAAAGVTVGAILVELKRGKEKRSAVNVTPSCGASGCGVFVTGRF